MPGQQITTKLQAILYTSDNLQKLEKPKGWLRYFFSKTRTQKSLVDIELSNDTSTIGYVGLQLMKGKIIVIDNTMEETRNLVIKENYILAHTSNIQIGKYFVADQINNQLDYTHQR